MKSIKINAALNVIYNLCKIIFPLISMPYAARVLHANGYGAVSYSNSIVRYFILLASLGIVSYSQREASVIRNKKEAITNFVNEIFTLNIISMIVSYIFLIFILLKSYKLRQYTSIIEIQSLAIILSTIGMEWINIVYEDYYYITIRYIIVQLLSIVALFIFVKQEEDYNLYALIMMLSSYGGAFINLFYIRKYIHRKLVKLNRIIKHLKPVLKLFCVSVATVIYVYSDITMLGLYVDDTQVGIYTMASNIYSVSKQLINAIFVVSIPRLAYYYGNQNKTNYLVLLKKIFDVLISIICPIGMGMFFLSKDILYIMGGIEFVEGSEILRILSFALLFSVLAGYYCNTFLLIAKKDNIYLLATIISALINILLNFIIIPVVGISGAAITTLIAEIIIAYIGFLYTKKEMGRIANYKSLFTSVIGTLIVFITCYFCKLFVSTVLFRIIFSITFSSIFYLLFLIFIKAPIGIFIISYLKQIMLYIRKLKFKK